MNKVLILAAFLLPMFATLAISGADNAVYVKNCTGTSDQGTVIVRISKSTVTATPEAPLQGYFQGDVLVNGTNVYSTQYIVYNPANGQYFTSGNSDLVLAGEPQYPETRLYLHVWNADGTVTVPSFDTIPVTCQ